MAGPLEARVQRLFRSGGSAYTHGLCLPDSNSNVVSSRPGDVTQLLLAWNKGDRDALEELIPVVYAELRRIARRYFRHERPDHTL